MNDINFFVRFFSKKPSNNVILVNSNTLRSFLSYISCGSSMRCTLRLQRRVFWRRSQCPDRCFQCRIWRYETGLPLLWWTSSSIYTPVKRCPGKLTPTWYNQIHSHIIIYRWSVWFHKSSKWCCLKWACAVCVYQLTVRALHMCPEAGQAPQECCLRVSLMPLRLNIDQVQINFLQLTVYHIFKSIVKTY